MDAAIAGMIGGLGGAALGAGIGAAASIIATRLQARGEREERQKDRNEQYKQMLYPKRLEVHQKAYWWNYKLYEALNTAIPDKDNDKVNKIANAARDWWESECLYLDEISRHEMMVAINYVGVYLHWKPEHGGKPPAVWEQLNKAHKAIVEGIGMKHIEELKEKKPEKGA